MANATVTLVRERRLGAIINFEAKAHAKYSDSLTYAKDVEAILIIRYEHSIDRMQYWVGEDVHT